MVICSETFDSIENTFEMGEKYLRKGGVLAYHKVYTKTPNSPKEWIKYEGPLLTLSELNLKFNSLGYLKK